MHKKFKVTFWNPSILQKRTYIFIVDRDDYNHLWNIVISYKFWNDTSEVKIHWDYMDFIRKFANNECRHNEYINIKEVA